MILTDVEKVCLNYRSSNESKLDTMTLEECERYRADGQFPEGSMGPKVEATVRFLKAGGRSAIITSLDHAKEALEGKAGTTVKP
jgi:carbamate kinase